MAKIKCKNLEGGFISHNKYKTPQGNEYDFERAAPTEIHDKKDIEFFLACGKGTLFEDMSPIKDAVKKVVEKVKEKVTGKEPEKEDGIHKHTYTDLKNMNKAEQIALIQKLAGSNTRYSRKEEERIQQILKLEKDLK